MTFLSIWLLNGFIAIMFLAIEDRYTSGIWFSGPPGCPRSLAVIIWMGCLTIFQLLGPIGMIWVAYKYFTDKD